MSKGWVEERRKDYYYRRAKREKYRSRASYKLMQLNKKYQLFSASDVVIDLGAAPGGWSQVAHEIVGDTGVVVSVDIEDMEPIEGVLFIKGDITKERTIDSVIAVIKESVPAAKRKEERFVDAVISDMSPNISGNYSIDHARSVYLAEVALTFAKKVLKPGGNFVVKVFQGDMFEDFLKSVKKEFEFAKAHSPKASRASSSEIYVVGKGYKG